MKTQPYQLCSPERIRVAELAREERKRKVSSIAHLLTVEALQEASEVFRKDGSAGVDGVAYTEYAVEVWDNLDKLHDCLRREVSLAARGPCAPAVDLYSALCIRDGQAWGVTLIGGYVGNWHHTGRGHPNTYPS